LRIQSGDPALGQLTFNAFPIDGFLSYKDLNTGIFHMNLSQYQSTFFHGPSVECPEKNNDKENESLLFILVTIEIKMLCNHNIEHLTNFLVLPTTIE